MLVHMHTRVVSIYLCAHKLFNQLSKIHIAHFTPNALWYAIPSYTPRRRHTYRDASTQSLQTRISPERSEPEQCILSAAAVARAASCLLISQQCLAMIS